MDGRMDIWTLSLLLLFHQSKMPNPKCRQCQQPLVGTEGQGEGRGTGEQAGYFFGWAQEQGTL